MTIIRPSIIELTIMLLFVHSAYAMDKVQYTNAANKYITQWKKQLNNNTMT